MHANMLSVHDLSYSVSVIPCLISARAGIHKGSRQLSTKK